MMFEGDNALKKVSVLSGGEKSRVLLGKLLVSPSNLLLLDEPTNHLDMESIDSLVEAIDQFPGAVIIVTHSEMILNATAKRLIVFDGGRTILFHGTYKDFLERIGWEGEDEELPPAKKTDEDIEKPSTRKKEQKRLRAEFIQVRSKTLGPIEQTMSSIEKNIMDLEKKIDEDNQALIRATTMGEGKSIASLSISIHNTGKEIEVLFEELDEVTKEYNARSRELEERYDEIMSSTQ
jgi:ATP-binding cassette subfamily F protein 3